MSKQTETLHLDREHRIINIQSYFYCIRCGLVREWSGACEATLPDGFGFRRLAPLCKECAEAMPLHEGSERATGTLADAS